MSYRLARNAPIDFARISLREKYETFNARYFNNTLPRDLKLAMRPLKGSTGLTKAIVRGAVRPRAGMRQVPQVGLTFLKMSITMSTLLVYDDALFDAFVLHEMIHVWTMVSGFPFEQHGPIFLEKAREVGAAAGLHIPIKHDTRDATPAAGAKRLGVILQRHPAGGAGFLLFDPKALDAFIAWALHIQVGLREALQFYLVTTTAWAFTTVSRRPARAVRFYALTGKVAETLEGDLSRGEKVAEVAAAPARRAM